VSSVLAGVWVMATFIITTLVLSFSIVTAGLIHGQSIQEVAVVEGERMRTALSIATAVSVDGASSSTVTLEVDNTGSTTVSEMDDMDAFLIYTAADSTPRTVRLSYVTSGPGDDEWLRSALSPDTFNPGLWDPTEQATLALKTSPAIKADTVATVVLSTPNGVTASRSWTHAP
jgi:hypothetical protein